MTSSFTTLDIVGEILFSTGPVAICRAVSSGCAESANGASSVCNDELDDGGDGDIPSGAVLYDPTEDE